MSVRWLASALASVIRIFEYVGLENPNAARRVGRELLLAGDSLTTFPRRGRRGAIEGTRELLAVPPCVVVHEVADDDAVSILRVWHSAQDGP